MVRFGSVQIWAQSKAYPKHYEQVRENARISQAYPGDSRGAMRAAVARMEEIGDDPASETERVKQQLSSKIAERLAEHAGFPFYQIMHFDLDNPDGGRYPIIRDTHQQLVIDGNDVKRFWQRVLERFQTSGSKAVVKDRQIESPYNMRRELERHLAWAENNTRDEFLKEVQDAFLKGDNSRLIDLDG